MNLLNQYREFIIKIVHSNWLKNILHNWEKTPYLDAHFHSFVFFLKKNKNSITISVMILYSIFIFAILNPISRVDWLMILDPGDHAHKLALD